MFSRHSSHLVQEPATAVLLHLNTSVQYVLLLALAGISLMETKIIQDSSRSKFTTKGRSWIMGATSICIVSLLFSSPLHTLSLMDRNVSDILQPKIWLQYLMPANTLAVTVSAAALLVALILSKLNLAANPKALITLCYVMAAIGPVFTGHTRSTSPVWLMMVTDTIHLVAGAFWLGGLLMLAMILVRPTLINISPESIPDIITRFSRAALWTIIALLTSGTAMSILIFQEPGFSLEERYTQILLVKICIVAFIGCIAMWNRRVVVPRLQTMEALDIVPYLRYTLLYEALLVIAVAVISGFLTGTGPGH